MLLRVLLALLAWLSLSANAGAVEIGAPAPGINRPLLSGTANVDLQQLRGKVVMVDFWASWCAPCLKSLPLYESLRQEFAREDFEIVAVSVDEAAEDAQRFLGKHPVSFPVAFDDGGSIAAAWSPPAMPTSYLIDRDGIVRGRHLGFQPKDIDALRAEIDHMIGER